MSGKTALSVALVAFLAFGLYKTFHKGTSDPNVVLQRYLNHWKSNNTSGMYPLLSERAKTGLKKQNVDNVADYYGYFIDRRSDLTGYQITSRQTNEKSGRFWVDLKLLDYVGREYQESVTFLVVKEPKGWRVDGWQKGGVYSLP